MEIKILGSGCAKCDELERLSRQVAHDAGIEVQIEQVSEFAQIMAYGVTATPALVVDGAVLAAGRVPTREDLVALIAARQDVAPGGCGCSGGCC